MRYPTSVQPLLTWFARHGLLVLAGLGALLLLVAEFSTLYEVRAVTAVPDGGSFGTGANHFYALLLLAVVSLPMAYGAVVGGSRPAALALIALAVVALFIILTIDLPDVNEEGLLGETYDSAKASPQEGFYLEIVGSLVLLAAGVAALVLRPGARETPRAHPAEPAAEPEPVTASG